MPRIAPHSTFISRDRSGLRLATLAIAGFVAPSSEETVRLCLDLEGTRYVDFREVDVVDFSQDDETGITTLHVDPFSTVTVSSIGKVPLVLRRGAGRPDATVVSSATVPLILVLERDDAPGGGGASSSCVEKYKEKCRRDPNRRREYCDSKEAEHLFEVFCSIFGDPIPDPAPPVA